MPSLLIKGRNPGQLFQIALAKSARARRRLCLPWLRRVNLDGERSYPMSEIRWLLDESHAHSILAAHPACHAEILSEADLAVSGWADVPGFGKRRIAFSDSSSLDSAEAYAHRLLCRLDFLRPLARAALISPTPQTYIERIEAILAQWQEAYLSSRQRDTVDDSIRILNLIETICLLKHNLNQDTLKSAIAFIFDCAWNIEINRTRTGNHLIYEGLALMALGYALPKHARASKWFRLGRSILERQILRQVRTDGFNAELSLNYHLITGTNFLKGWLLALKTANSMSGSYRERLGEMTATAACFQAADGGFPALGDSDRMAGPSREEKEGCAFASIGRKSASAISSEVNFERAWLLAGGDFHFPSKPTPRAQAQPFSAGGYYILRRSSGPRIIFDAGPFGLPGASHHGHADSLSFEIHLKSGRFWVDPGGFSYVNHPARAFARSTAAHNTLQVDSRSSSEISDSFGFGRGARARCTKVIQVPSGFLLVGEHDGYAPIIHRRALFGLPGEHLKLLILDRLEGEGLHSVEAFFHADAGWCAAMEPGGVRWEKGEDQVIQIVKAESDLQMNIVVGQTEPAMQGWVSHAFGNYLPAPTLVMEGKAQLPFEMASLVVEGVKAPASLHLDLKECRAQIEALKIGWRWLGETPEITVGN